MTQAIQPFLAPAAAATASPRQGAASLFDSEPAYAGFGDHLAEQSRRSDKQAGPRDAGEPRVKEHDAEDKSARDAGRGTDAASTVKEKQPEREDGGRVEGDGADVSDPKPEIPAAVEDEAGRDAATDADAEQAAQQVADAAVASLASSKLADTSALQAASAGEESRLQRPALRTSGSGGDAAVAPVLQPGAAGTETVNAVKAVATDVAANAAMNDTPADPLALQAAPAASGKDTAGQVLTNPAGPATPSAIVPADTAPATANAPQGSPATASAGAQLVDTQAARETEQSALNNARLTRGLANAVQQRGGAVTLRLTPPEIGTVRIQMQITGTSLAATLHAETASAHQMLTQQLGQLRASLESQGLSVERLHVQQMQQTQPGTANEQAGDNPQQQPNDGRSRGQQDRTGQDARGDARDRDGRPGNPRSFSDHLDSTDDPSTA